VTAGIGGVVAPPHESHPRHALPRTRGRGEERSAPSCSTGRQSHPRRRRSSRRGGTAWRGGAAEEMRRRAGRGEERRRGEGDAATCAERRGDKAEEMWRHAGRGEERRGGEVEKMRAEAKEMRRRARRRRRGGGARGEEARRGERFGGGDARREGEVWPCQHRAAVPCQGRVMGQAGGPWPERPYVSCRHEHAADRAVPPMGRAKRPCHGPCRRPMSRLYTYTSQHVKIGGNATPANAEEQTT
jgi:hypothetical protein